MKQVIERRLNNKTMRGVIHHVSEDLCVLFFHGFTGHKTESSGLFRFLSEQLETNHISSIRFDWFGHGESDMAFQDLTVNLLIEQANDLITYAKSRYQKVFLLGFSMGGAIALQTVSKKIDGLILLAPAINMDQITNDLFSSEDEQLVDVHGFQLHRTFADGWKMMDYTIDKDYNGPIIVLQGEQDLAVPESQTKQLVENLTQTKYVVLEGADHCFTTTRYHQKLSDHIVSFIHQTK